MRRDPEHEQLPERSRIEARYGQQGLGLSTYGNELAEPEVESRRGVTLVDLGASPTEDGEGDDGERGDARSERDDGQDDDEDESDPAHAEMATALGDESSTSAEWTTDPRLLRPLARWQRRDSRIAEDVIEALRAAEVDASDLDVKVEHAVVLLRGRARDVDQRRVTELVCSHVRGVIDVVNQLETID